MMVISNTTAITPNATWSDATESQSSGLAVGLSFFFVILVVIIGGVAYLYLQRRKSKHVINSNKFQTVDDQQTKPAESHFTDFDGNSHQIADCPVYENFRERPSDITESRHYSNMDFASDSPVNPSDLYLQCDSEHDAIYSNDPTFSYCNQPDNCEEDVYIVPDA